MAPQADLMSCVCSESVVKEVQQQQARAVTADWSVLLKTEVRLLQQQESI